MNNQPSFIDPLLDWFHQNKRTLPFRQEKDPYKIWISEIMAQQTQIDTLIPYYERFIRKFPNIVTLANAAEETVLKYWEGLGYYSRARNLHKAAKVLKNDYNCIFPTDPQLIQKLPGIGPYTCGAIASIAYNYKIPAVDGNVLRVITRLMNWEDDIAIPQTKKKITGYLIKIMPDQAGNFNESLMELGAMICTPKSPACEHCPIVSHCLAYSHHNVEHIPIKSKKIRQKEIKVEVGLLSCNDKLFLIKRPSKGLLANLWAFPIIESASHPGEAIEQLMNMHYACVESYGLLGRSRHVFTHIIWDMDVYGFKVNDFKNMNNDEDAAVFATVEEIKEKYTLPTAFSKLLKFYKSKCMNPGGILSIPNNK